LPSQILAFGQGIRTKKGARMRIREIAVSGVPPVRRFEVADLSDTVVLAGANGVGKTRLVEALIKYMSNPSGANMRIVIEATDKPEREQWGKEILDTSNPPDAQLFRKTLQQNKLRRNFRSSVLYFESDRSIQQVKPLTFSWDMPDPWKENVSWNYALSGLRNRFPDTLHAIFRKIQSQRNSIAIQAQQLRKKGYNEMKLAFGDPLAPFKTAFAQLLGPKILEDADISNQTLKYSLDGQEFNIQSLSSGEREVLNITFDFILRRPLHCIVFFDEPELHLHSELSSKLINTLKTVGEHNQFIFCTHSPDIISGSLDDSVIFVGPDRGDGANQAISVTPEDRTNEALRSLGHSIGIISLGKKIVLVEGTESSLDKQTYGHILRNRFPDLVLVPSAGKHTISSFRTILSDILDRTIWGVEFRMLCDRDAVPLEGEAAQLKEDSRGRLRVLSRYHLENYFLDEDVLAQVFKEMEPSNSRLTIPGEIRRMLRDIARSQISYATSLIVSKHFREEAGNLDLMPKGCDNKTAAELKAMFRDRQAEEEARFQEAVAVEELDTLVEETFSRLTESVDKDDGTWLAEIPGRQVFSIFCSRARIAPGRLKTLYIGTALDSESSPFQEIVSIFEAFSKNGTNEPQ